MFLYPGTFPPSTESCGQNAREARVRQQEDEDHPIPVCGEDPRRHPQWPRPPWRGWPQPLREAGEVTGASAHASSAGFWPIRGRHKVTTDQSDGSGPGPGPGVLCAQPLRQGRARLPGRVAQCDAVAGQCYTRWLNVHQFNLTWHWTNILWALKKNHE